MHRGRQDLDVVWLAASDWAARLAHHLQHTVDDLKEAVALHVVVVHQID